MLDDKSFYWERLIYQLAIDKWRLFLYLRLSLSRCLESDSAETNTWFHNAIITNSICLLMQHNLLIA